MKKSYILLSVLIVLIVLGLIFFNNINYKVIDNPQTDSNLSIKIQLFYGKGCPHCAKLEIYLEELGKKYPLDIERYEIYFNNTNRKIMQDMLEKQGRVIEGVPTLFIKDKIIVGFSDSLKPMIEQEVEQCYQECKLKNQNSTYISSESSPTEDPELTRFKQKLTIPAVIAAAFLDSINPCEFAILILLLSTVLLSNNKRKALFAGLAFSLSIFISYFLMGLGLYTAIASISATRIFYVVVSFLAIILGLFNLKDYLWYGKFFIMEVPLKWRPRMKLLIKGITSVWGAFLIGFVISLFLLPCTSGPYIVILGLLSETATRSSAILWLLLYNFIFILPMLAITIIISQGIVSSEKIEMWRQKNLKVFHLIAGLILILLGIFMFLSMKLGWI